MKKHGLRKIFSLLFLFSLVTMLPQSIYGQGQTWKVGDKVDASFEGSSYSFYPAVILEFKNGKYKVRYNGYDAGWDDWVPADKIHPPKVAVPVQAAAPTQNLSVAVAQAQGPRAVAGDGQVDCHVGSRLSRAGMTNRPAVITEIDPRKGLYRVKYDNGDLPEWLPARLFAGCNGAALGGISADYFIGKWSMFVGPTPHYEDRGSDRYLVVGPGGKAPPLVINRDGTYVWTVDSRTVIRGQWRNMIATDLKYNTKAPAIRLINGESGQDWQMWLGIVVGTGDNRDRMTIEGMKIGLSYSGTRMN